MRSFQCYKKGRVAIFPFIQIILQVNFRPCIEINQPFLVTFTKDHAFTLIKIDIFPIERHHLTNTHSR